MDGDSTVQPAFFNYLLTQAKANLEILRPQEFSNGLAKLMCLSEELFTVPVKAKGCILQSQSTMEVGSKEKVII